MRDPDRINRILGMVKEIWRRVPDQRLTQLLYNVLEAGPRDIYYKDDDELEAKLDEIWGWVVEQETSGLRRTADPFASR